MNCFRLTERVIVYHQNQPCQALYKINASQSREALWSVSSVRQDAPNEWIYLRRHVVLGCEQWGRAGLDRFALPSRGKAPEVDGTKLQLRPLNRCVRDSLTHGISLKGLIRFRIAPLLGYQVNTRQGDRGRGNHRPWRIGWPQPAP